MTAQLPKLDDELRLHPLLAVAAPPSQTLLAPLLHPSPAWLDPMSQCVAHTNHERAPIGQPLTLPRTLSPQVDDAFSITITTPDRDLAMAFDTQREVVTWVGAITHCRRKRLSTVAKDVLRRSIGKGAQSSIEAANASAAAATASNTTTTPAAATAPRQGYTAKAPPLPPPPPGQSQQHNSDSTSSYTTTSTGGGWGTTPRGAGLVGRLAALEGSATPRGQHQQQSPHTRWALSAPVHTRSTSAPHSAPSASFSGGGGDDAAAAEAAIDAEYRARLRAGARTRSEEPRGYSPRAASGGASAPAQSAPRSAPAAVSQSSSPPAGDVTKAGLVRVIM